MRIMALVLFVAMAAALSGQPAAAQVLAKGVHCANGLYKEDPQVAGENDDAYKLRVCQGKKLVPTPKDSACKGEPRQVSTALDGAALEAVIAELCPTAKAEPAEVKKADAPPPKGNNPGCCKPAARIEFYPSGGCKLIGVDRLEDAPLQVQQMWEKMCKRRVAYAPQRHVHQPPVKPAMGPPPSQPPAEVASCPNGTVMEVNVYDYGRMSAEYQALTTAITGYELNRGAITTTTATNRSFSREVGKALGQKARGGQRQLWSTVPVPVQVFWQYKQDTRRRQPVGTFTITGHGKIPLPGGDQKIAAGYVLVVVYPTTFISPPLGTTMKAREIWFYPSEWTGCESRQHSAHPPAPGS